MLLMNRTPRERALQTLFVLIGFWVFARFLIIALRIAFAETRALGPLARASRRVARRVVSRRKLSNAQC